MEEKRDSQYPARTNAFATLRDKIYIHRLPSYGNKIFFSLGFLALTSLVILAATGITMAFMGQAWWLFNPWGIYLRSIHLWTVQAFIAILILHFIVGFSTSGFRPPRRAVWVFGAIIFCLALIQTEFGYGLRGDFSSQYRAVSGADFWNGAYLGHWVNPLSFSQSFALHVAIIPFTILMLFLAHYILEHAYGISRPYRKDIKYKMVAADHRILFIRGGMLMSAILVLAFFFHSPYVPALTISGVTEQDPSLVATTLLAEFTHTSDTATYLDSIDPYTFDTRQVFVVAPYQEFRTSNPGTDAWQLFESESTQEQDADIADAGTYVANVTADSVASTTNPVVMMVSTLMPLAKSGLYESIVDAENPSINYTYSLRFLNDMGVPDDRAAALGFSTPQWGMAKDEPGATPGLPPGSWWLAPLGLMNTAFNLLNNQNGDRIAAEMLGFLMFVFITFPYIPYLNRLPEVIGAAPFIWRDRSLDNEPGEGEIKSESNEV